MDGVEEMARLHHGGDAVIDVVVDEKGAEQRLLGFDVVGKGMRVGVVVRHRRSVCHGNLLEAALIALRRARVRCEWWG